ncbi:MAG: DUF5615 family PIN-like protein [Flavobacterium sp.]|nr:DUF5615 family PIN-like protein [Flavobacterium sp.]
MKLLFDQNTSHRVVGKLLNDFTEAKYMRYFIMQYATDIEIWHFAKQHEFTLITFGAGFNNFVTLKSHLPKVIWWLLGNTLLQTLVEKIKAFKSIITLFVTYKVNNSRPR